MFHLYVCAAFLMKFADDAKKERDFQVGDYVTYFILLVVLQLGDCLKVYVPYQKLGKSPELCIDPLHDAKRARFYAQRIVFVQSSASFDPCEGAS